MKLASLREGGRDGTLIVARRDLARAVRVPGIAATLQAALDDWDQIAPRLAEVAVSLEEGAAAGAFELDPSRLAAPLPRAFQFLDGSAYLNHVALVRQARGAKMPPSFRSEPLMYQGTSDRLLGPCDPILAQSEDWGIDLEAEVVVITGDVPMGATVERARDAIRLVALINDVSLRNLIPGELAKGFGFVHGKPPSAFSPVAVTLDELGDAWDGGKLHLPLVSHINGRLLGRPNAGRDMNFDFPALVAHGAKSRALGAGTIVGAGTVSNVDPADGFSCLAEIRTIESIEKGAPATPFLKFGDRLRIEMLDADGRSIFGAIEQEVVQFTPA